MITSEELKELERLQKKLDMALAILEEGDDELTRTELSRIINRMYRIVLKEEPR